MSFLQQILRLPKTHPLATRMAIYIVLCSSVFAVLATAVQLFADYRGEISQIERRFSLIEDSYTGSIEESLWAVNDRQIGLLLQGIYKIPDIEYVELKSEIELEYSLGTPTTKNAIISRSYPLYSPRKTKQKELIGLLRVDATLTEVYNRLFDRLIVIFVTQTVKAILVSSFIILIFQMLVSRHLSRMAAYARGLRFNTLKKPLILQRYSVRDDELQQVANAINHMRLSLAGELDETARMSVALNESEQRFRGAFEQATVGLGHLNEKLKWIRVNPQLCQLLQCSEGKLLGKTYADSCIYRAELDDIANLHRVLDGERPCYASERLCQSPDGNEIWVKLTASVVENVSAAQRYVVVVVEDISSRKHAESESTKLVQAIEQSNTAVSIVDLTGYVEYINTSMLARLALTESEGANYTFEKIFERIGDDDVGPEALQAFHDRKCWHGELKRHGHGLAELWFNVSLTPIQDQNGEISHFLVQMQDITEQKLSQRQLMYQANYDPLTELPNRNMMFKRMNEAIAQAQESKHIGALIYIDLDHFKYVNDTFGHAVGDELLIQVANRLRSLTGETDTIARLGGDEFLVVIPKIEDHVESKAMAVKIIDSFQGSFSLISGEVFMSPSLGITHFPADGVSASVLLCNADAAMYRAKLAGRNRYAFFNQEMSDHAKNRVAVETELRYAMERGELCLHYQPIVDLDSYRVNAAEALIRWDNAALGQLAPDAFLPIAEDTGLIIPIGKWIISEAFMQLKQWQADIDSQFVMSINISPRQLLEEGFYEYIDSQLTEHDIKPETIELEITEHMLMANTQYTLGLLMKLHERGFQLSLDDFGTGYSALSYLKRYPFSVLKIDRSFIVEARQDKSAAALVRAIIAMARELSLDIIAEGVEEEADVLFLRNEKCLQVQGYYFSKPLCADAFASLNHQKIT